MKHNRAKDLETAGQAAQWLHSIGSAGAPQRKGFADWLLESRRNVRAALLTIAIEKELEQFDPQKHLDVEAMLANSRANVLPLDEAASPAQQWEARARVQLRRRMWHCSIAATLAGLILAGALLLRWELSRQPVFATTTGQQQSIKLDDGSVVHLNTESRIRVEFSRHERNIQLLAGEALFDVQREPGRPFQVHVGEAVVRALGTEFDVDRRTTSVMVAVLDGRVQIVNASEQNRSQIVSAGQEARITDHGPIENAVTPNIKRRVAWRERRLEFQDDPLATVVAQFNRFNRVPRLRLEGPSVGARTYTGIFNADDPQSLAEVLSEDRDLSVESKDDEIVIRARPATVK